MVTAMTIISEIGPAGMRITGYNTGDIVLTNLAQLAFGAKQKKKAINKKYLPPGKPAVTAITAIPVTSAKIAYARVFIGFSDASIFIIDVFLKKDGIPSNSRKPIPISQKSEGCSVQAITILNDRSIAIALANNKIKIINFSPTLLTCKKSKHVELNKKINPMIPVATQNVSAVILPIQQPSGPSLYCVYVLTESKHLVLCKYDQNFAYIDTTTVSYNVSKIATPTSGNNFLIFSTTGNAILQTSPLDSALPQPINMAGTNLSTGISAMTSSDSTLYIVTADNNIAEISLAQDGDTTYQEMPAPVPGSSAPPPQGNLIDFSGQPPRPEYDMLSALTAPPTTSSNPRYYGKLPPHAAQLPLSSGNPGPGGQPLALTGQPQLPSEHYAALGFNQPPPASLLVANQQPLDEVSAIFGPPQSSSPSSSGDTRSNNLFEDPADDEEFGEAPDSDGLF